MTEKEAQNWKAAIYDKMRESLISSRVVDAGDMMMGGYCKILVFENNDMAEEFDRQLKQMHPFQK